MKKQNISKKLSKAQWQDSWREEFMDFDDKKAISANTLAKGISGK